MTVSEEYQSVRIGQDLFKAIYAKDKALIETLLNAGADPNTRSDVWTPLHLAAKEGFTSVVAPLVGAGADVAAREGKDGMQPLHVAAKEGHVDMVKALLEAGANIDGEDDKGKTPLMYSILYFPKVTPTLVAADADVEKKDKDGNTALHFIAKLKLPASLLTEVSESQATDGPGS